MIPQDLQRGAKQACIIQKNCATTSLNTLRTSLRIYRT